MTAFSARPSKGQSCCLNAAESDPFDEDKAGFHERPGEGATPGLDPVAPDVQSRVVANLVDRPQAREADRANPRSPPTVVRSRRSRSVLAKRRTPPSPVVRALRERGSEDAR